MAAIDESRACLRLFGDDLDPDEISAILGSAPTKSERKGDVIRNQTTGQSRTVKSGGWRLEAPDARPEDIDGQVERILSRLTSDLEKWRALTLKYQADIFCGLFMREENEGIELSPETLRALGQRGISIGFDIYAPSDRRSET
jgi:hypothetical protein